MYDYEFESMDEMLDLLTRGGEIEFIFHGRHYSLLPDNWSEERHWVDIVRDERHWGGAIMGEERSYGWVWKDLKFREVPNYTTVDNYKLKDIIHKIDVTFRPDK